MGISLGGLAWIVIGIIVAGLYGYLTGWNNPGNAIEGLIAIVLWPVVIIGSLFGVDLHGLFA